MKQEGFIALITALMLSATLTALLISMNYATLLHTENFQDYENRELSLEFAKSCIENGIYYLTTGGVDDNMGCSPFSVEKTGGGFTIKASATYQKYTTTLQAYGDYEGNHFVIKTLEKI